MLKKITISTLFVVAVALAGMRAVEAKSGGAKAGKVEVIQKAQGLCPGFHC